MDGSSSKFVHIYKLMRSGKQYQGNFKMEGVKESLARALEVSWGPFPKDQKRIG